MDPEIRETVVPIIRTYIEGSKKWTADQYNIQYTGRTDDAGHLIINIVHKDDPNIVHPGGSKSIQLFVDLKRKEVIKELAFQ